MNKITFPLRQGTSGPAVADLQDALQQCLERRAVLANDEAARREWSERLRPERAAQKYSDATGKLLSIFQRERQLQPSGDVDAPTADTLNRLLTEWALLDRDALPRFHVVAGQVKRADGLPLQDLRVHAVHEAERGAIRLGEDTTDGEGRYTIRYEPLPGVEAINLRVFAIGEDGKPLQSSDLVRNAKPLESIDLTAAMAGRPVQQERIEGRVILEHGLPAKQIKLRLYRRDFGGKSALLGETTTLADGEYAFAYDPGDRGLSVEVRALGPAGEEIPLSEPLNNLKGESPAVNLVAPGSLQPMLPEYRRLADDLKPLVGEMTKLGEARETDSRQDLTVLNRATGWDARLIALAALTERLSVDPDVQLPQEAVYGLLRTGLPSEKLLLAQVEPDVVEKALKTARDAGIVEFNDQQIGRFKEQFTAFATRARLALPVPGSRSTYGELLKASGLSDDVQAKFGPVYLRHRGDGSQLWDEARNAGLDTAQIGKLQLQGQLAFLAGNSEPMTTRLMQKQIDDPAQLIEQNFDRAEQWKAEARALAGNDEQKLVSLIPVSYPGETTEARLDAYAEDMARKVRLSYPTQVLGRMIEQDNADAFKLGADRDATAKLLKSATRQGFRLGETPVAAFLETRRGVRDGMSEAEVQAAQQQMKKLQRVYQITPSNEAMPVLMGLGMTSAHDVMAYSEAEFMELYAAKYLELHGKRPTPGESRLVYRKASQVSSVTYNLFTIAKKMDSEAPVAGLSAPVEVRERTRSELIKQFPTLESLFGSMDFCECEHCRSVLSPAAYLVDLLQFVDAEPEVWANFLAHWKATHGDQDYPHKDNNGNAMTPYAVLVERRPDLPHIALTCENTHTALPYIDVGNEILEYYVAIGKLEQNAAHDTGDATTAELLAEPQNVIREAYDKLREARYPLNLPFDLWLETVRAFCNHSETPLARVLDVLRPNDDLFAPSQLFDRSSIFAESLGLSPAEASIFTNPDPLADWHELYGFQTAAEAVTEAIDPVTGQRIDLNSAKALSRRLGVTYKELVELIESGFVNPSLSELALLQKLEVSIQDARLYKDHKAFFEQNKDLVGTDRSALSPADQQRFDDLSKTLPNTQKTGWEIVNELAALEQRLNELAATFNTPLSQLQTQLVNMPFGKVLVLTDTDAGGNFDLTTLQYADGAKADPIAFLRINLFVRLWRKLGWTLEETDRALNNFIPQSVPFDGTASNLVKQPLRTALIYLAHLKSLDEKLKVGKQSRLRLMTLWSNIATTGKKPLYAQLFLTRSVLKADPIFDHPLGQYLAEPGILIKDHFVALQGALGVTADDISRIFDDAGKSLATAELSLPHVSLIYRYSLLAKGLNLSIRDLIALRHLSGLDPFKPLHPNPLANQDQDHPLTQTLRFIEIADEVKDGGLRIEDLVYLLRHRFDETGKYRPNREGTLALLRTLANGVAAIGTENAIPDDPGALSEEVLRQKLSLVLTPDVVERFLAMMNGTAEFTATKSGVAVGNRLAPKGFVDEPAIREVRYNEARQEQKLTFRGVLFDTEKNTLMGRLPKPVPPNPHVPSAMLGELLNEVQRQARSFFEKHLQKQAPNLQPASGFLDGADFDLLFAPMPAGLTEAQMQARVRQQRTRLAQAFLPFLQQRLIRQFIVQTMVGHTAADPVLVESLLADERLLAGPSLDALAATAVRGVTAIFFASVDGSGAALTTISLADANTGLKDKDGNPLKPAGANSARLEGYLEVPVPGAYRFNVALHKKDAEAELRFAHLAKPTLTGAANIDGDEIGHGADEYAELKAGVPYRFTLELRKLNGGEARLFVLGETLPKDRLAQLILYPMGAMEAAERAVLLLTKALLLVQALGLSERETRYLLAETEAFGGPLPVRASDDTPDGVKMLFAQFLRLGGYARLKRDLAGGTDDLIGVFEANATGLLAKVYPLIAKLTRREEAMVKASAEALFATPAFDSEKPLLRLWDLLQVVERFGVPVASMLDWGRVVSPAANAGQRFAIARDLKEAIKARLEPGNWQRVAQLIFDKLRQRQRDALVSHVMHQRGFDRMEQLYEYFLIDPGMEPVVQTSRIRLAISSVQLFIQRCLLNLEPKVHPSLIDAKQWEWMKRYRVWEANRKIFLFPENWLEPEFRDDKTHLFVELEGALLQGDVSNDLVEDAFLNYLKRLDELARLDIVAMHIEDNPDPARRALHIIGRTFSQPHKYLYRRFAHRMWTPWEELANAEIEGDHLAPVVWRDRLYLFWVTFMDKPDESGRPGTRTSGRSLADAGLSDVVSDVADAGAKKRVDMQLHWSEYLQGEWSTGESGGFVPVTKAIRRPIHKGDGLHFVRHTVPLTVPRDFDYRSVFVHVTKERLEDGEEGGVFVHLGGQINQSFYLAGRNSTPEKARYGSQPESPYTADIVRATRFAGSSALKVSFQERITTEPGKTPPKATPSILQQAGAYTLLPCNNDLTALGVSEDAFQNATDPAEVQAETENGIGEIASLMKPIFYQDNTHTLFVEPEVTERTIEEWQEWVTRTPQPEPDWVRPDWWKDIVLVPGLPLKGPVPEPVPPEVFDPGSLINPRPRFDWLVNPATALEFDGVLVGAGGRPGLKILATDGAAIAEDASPVNVNPGSGLATGSAVVVANGATLDGSGLTQVSGGLNVIGRAGFNAALKKNFSDMNDRDFETRISGAPGNGR